jgi:hypothetical protein
LIDSRFQIDEDKRWAKNGSETAFDIYIGILSQLMFRVSFGFYSRKGRECVNKPTQTRHRKSPDRNQIRDDLWNIIIISSMQIRDLC